MKILFLIPYPLKEAPSQRFRFEQYITLLKDNGHTITIQSFLGSHNGSVLSKSGNQLRKLWVLIEGFAKRFFVLFTALSYDFVFIHRETTPIGPPVFEWILSKILRKKIIYDFDDSIWLTDKTDEGTIERIIRWRGKVKWICKWSYKVSCGNAYLCNYARMFNENVILNPTTIDTVNLHRPELYQKENNNVITIGWTGSHSTLKYLAQISPVIQSLQNKYANIRFLVIANKNPSLGIKTDFKSWNISTEIKDLFQIDIGIMPLPDDQWANGKCGFKALQYMALEIPAVASPVGVNSTIIQHGVNGLLCSDQSEWMAALEKLINNETFRRKLALNGRSTVEQNYSLTSNSVNFLALFT